MCDNLCRALTLEAKATAVHSVDSLLSYLCNVVS